MNARELLDALGRLPGARRVSSGDGGIVDSVEVRGIELARAEEADERRLRAAWRERQGAAQMPLLLLADDPAAAGCVRALGPARGDGPIRVVAGDELLRVLKRHVSESREAVRRLDEELGRLDGTSAERAPRMGERGFFPDHTAERRDEYRRTTPGERVSEAIEVSRTATKLAVIGYRRRAR